MEPRPPSGPDAALLGGLLAAASALVEDAGRLARETLRAGFSFRRKPDASFVTDLDLAIEKRLRDELGRRFPDHGILGEELGSEPAPSPWRWVIDPIDGTLSLRHRIPLFGILLALEHHGEPVVGVLGLPELRRVYGAARGLGARCGREELRIEDVPSDEALAEEVLALADRAQFAAAGQSQLFATLTALLPCVRTYPDAFGHALAVQGSVGAMLDLGIRRWDLAATRVLVEEAGGLFETLAAKTVEGEPRFDVLFGKPRMVRWLLSQVTGAPPAASAPPA